MGICSKCCEGKPTACMKDCGSSDYALHQYGLDSCMRCYSCCSGAMNNIDLETGELIPENFESCLKDCREVLDCVSMCGINDSCRKQNLINTNMKDSCYKSPESDCVKRCREKPAVKTLLEDRATSGCIGFPEDENCDECWTEWAKTIGEIGIGVAADVGAASTRVGRMAAKGLRGAKLGAAVAGGFIELGIDIAFTIHAENIDNERRELTKKNFDEAYKETVKFNAEIAAAYTESNINRNKLSRLREESRKAQLEWIETIKNTRGTLAEFGALKRAALIWDQEGMDNSIKKEMDLNLAVIGITILVILLLLLKSLF